MPQELISSGKGKTCLLRSKHALRPACLQRSHSNCLVTPEPCEERFIETDAGLLTNAKVHFQRVDGKMHQSNAITQFLPWTDVSVVFMDDMVFEAPNKGSHDVHVITHYIKYDDYMAYMMEEPVLGGDANTILNHRLWQVKTALDQFVQKTLKSPFLSKTMLILLLGIFMIFAVPIFLEIIKCMWTNAHTTTQSLASNFRGQLQSK